MTQLLTRYEALVAAGELRPDPEQKAAAVRLQALQDELESGNGKLGLFDKLFGKKTK